MSSDQARKLDSLSPGGGGTVSSIYDDGASSADQTANIDPAKGGPLIAKAAAVAIGSLFRALTSVSAVVLEAIDDVIPKVLAVGAFIQNDPVFGSPVMGSQTPGGYMSYTADGVGPNWAGTGMTVVPGLVRLTVNDNPVLYVAPGGVIPGAGIAFVDNYGTSGVTPTLTIAANTIAPQYGVSFVTGPFAVLKTITPVAAFTAYCSYWAEFIPLDAWAWDASDNIAIPGTAVVGKLLRCWYDINTSKWYPSYTS